MIVVIVFAAVICKTIGNGSYVPTLLRPNCPGSWNTSALFTSQDDTEISLARWQVSRISDFRSS
jgi:hypothetical protein